MYQAVITPITTSKHPNADRLQLGNCCGFQVVTSLEAQNGQLGAFFPCDGRLSDKMLDANNLRKSQGGYFDDNGRVRAQSFRKVKSEGIWLPLSSLAWTGVDPASLTAGQLFTELNGQEVCEKYFTPATLRAIGSKTKVKRGETPWFRKQPDTPQLRFVIDQIPDGSLIYFTEKLHGTSGRFGYARETNPWWRKLLRLPEKVEWRKLVGSKNVILSDKPGGGYYEDETFRFKVKDLPIYKGETLYYEIVGSTTTGQLIMPMVTIKDPELKKLYGSQMQYTYGSYPGESPIYVYRITRTNEDGFVTELSWPQVKGRCAELGIKHCPEINTPRIKSEDQIGALATTAGIQWVADNLLEGPSLLDKSHIREGICLRIEQPDGRITFAKHKSFTFKVLEGIIKDDANYVDTEEAA
jgi:hypothetical protein